MTGPSSAGLTFRPFAAADVAIVHEHWNDRDVRRYLWDDQPVALATVRAVLDASDATFAASGYGIWILRDAAGVLAGTCGLRPVEPGGDVEVLYSIAPARWGRGLATEAARAVLRFAFAGLGIPRVLGGVDDGNDASRRVLEKLGMRPLATQPGTPSGVGHLAVERDAFLASLRRQEDARAAAPRRPSEA